MEPTQETITLINSYSASVSYSYYFCDVYYDLLHNFMINVTTMAIIFGILALFSNSLFLFTVAKQRHLRQTPVRVYLASLSFIDACVSISFTLLAFRWLLDSVNRIFSFNVHLVLFLRFPFQLMSSLLIVLVTVERYKAICRPMAHFTSTHKVNSKYFYIFGFIKCLLAVSVTIVVFVLMVIIFETWQIEEHECPDGSSSVWVRKLPAALHDAIYKSVYVINYVMVAIDLGTIIVSVTLSVLIYRQLGQVPILRSGGGYGKRYAREQKNMTKMVVANTLVFCLFVLLLDVCSCIFLNIDFSVGDGSIKTYLYLVFVLTLLNSGVNPIIYNTFGSVYRTAFLKTFHCAKFAHTWIGISITERSSTSFETQISALQKFNIEEKSP